MNEVPAVGGAQVWFMITGVISSTLTSLCSSCRSQKAVSQPTTPPPMTATYRAPSASSGCISRSVAWTMLAFSAPGRSSRTSAEPVATTTASKR